jgi:hypothetical protein
MPTEFCNLYLYLSPYAAAPRHTNPQAQVYAG